MNKNKLLDGWREVKLGEILASPIQNGYSPVCQEIETGRWVLSLGALTGNSFDKAQKKAVPLEKRINNDFLLQYGDILISRSNTIDKVGRTAVFRDEIHNCFYPDLIMRFRINEKLVATDFLEKVLQSNIGRKYFEKSAAGTSGSMVKINKTTIENFIFIFPSLPEQNAIADTLSVWDTMIEKTEQLIAEKEKKRQWLINELIEQPSKINKWQKIPLKNILMGGSKEPVIDTSLYKKITVKLHKKGIEFADQSREMVDTRPFYIRHSGEVIIGKQNYFNGSIAVVNDQFDGCICSNAIMSFKVTDKVNTKFLYEAISYNNYLKKRAALANGTGQKELAEKEFLNFDISLPSLSEQNRIVDILDSAQREIDLLKQLLEHYKKQKRGLMQKLLTGAWRIQSK